MQATPRSIAIRRGTKGRRRKSSLLARTFFVRVGLFQLMMGGVVFCCMLSALVLQSRDVDSASALRIGQLSQEERKKRAEKQSPALLLGEREAARKRSSVEATKDVAFEPRSSGQHANAEPAPDNRIDRSDPDQLRHETLEDLEARIKDRHFERGDELKEPSQDDRGDGLLEELRDLDPDVLEEDFDQFEIAKESRRRVDEKHKGRPRFHAKKGVASLVEKNGTDARDGRRRDTAMRDLGEEGDQEMGAAYGEAITAKRKSPAVSRNAREAPIEGDPLRAETWEFKRGKLPITPSVEYLGTLIDAGRHYFPMEWLKRAVDRLSDMNYNLIHFRLTDDQAFNVLLNSRPELAYPTAANNPDRLVYSTEELRELTKYAKERGIQIMPEIDLPGHAGAWAGIPDMLVKCPNFVCLKGYGVPLNVSHHEIRPILKDVIREVVDIFDQPPFLHLGGDEVSMADRCFVDARIRELDYVAFEKMLSEILQEIGYPEDRVARWEAKEGVPKGRAGQIEHFWETHPAIHDNAKARRVFVSTWLYFDTNKDQTAYDVYEKTQKILHYREGVVPTAIIAGTFELSTEFWYDRNVLGRLLATAIGASEMEIPDRRSDLRNAVIRQYRKFCEEIGLGDYICGTNGAPVISTRYFHNKWRSLWDVWKQDICERLTETVNVRGFETDRKVQDQVFGSGNEFFWRNFPLERPFHDHAPKPRKPLPGDSEALQKHKVAHSGVILDTTVSIPSFHRLDAIIRDYVSTMGFNLAQLRLISNVGFVYEPDVQRYLAHSLVLDDNSRFYNLKHHLGMLVQKALGVGVEMMPEIHISTDAGGWIGSGYLAECPKFYCTGKGTPTNVNDIKFLPVLFVVISELRKFFSSRFVHLGTDEREASQPCFEEADIKPDFHTFENKIEAILPLTGIRPNDIIRTENSERVRYPGRAGNVTQYRTGQTDVRPDESFFLTVDLFSGDAHSVYQNTLKAVELMPLGVMAEIRQLSSSSWAKLDIPKRLLAFAMGLSEVQGINDDKSFQETFFRLCQALNLAPDCSAPGTVASSSLAVFTDGPEFRKLTCEYGTTEEKKRIMKTVKPYFEAVTMIAALQ